MRSRSHFFPALSLLAALMLLTGPVTAKPCPDLGIAPKSEIPSMCATMTVTMLHDSTRPYLYVANKEAGLKIYGIANPAAPSLAATVPVSDLGKLEVMNLSQQGNLLFLAIGNHFTNPQAGGMAIVDVTDPAHPVVKDFYIVPGSASGAGIAKAEGKVAYLGAMQSGLAVLDISDPADIKSLSLFMPDREYPVANPNKDLYNVRGMEVRNGIAYVAFDAGGLRIVDCRKPDAPREIGRFVNPAMYKPLNHAKAYNNLVLDGNKVYAAVDYCGMEVLDVTDTAAIALTGWWNPYHCPDNNWFSSPVHANEIQMDKACRRIFMSTGKSDLWILDVSDPAHPDSCGGYGGEGNALGTWGVGLWQDQIYLSYICTLGIPFASNWTGVKILGFDRACGTAVRVPRATMDPAFYPTALRMDAAGRLIPTDPFAILAADPGSRPATPLFRVPPALSPPVPGP